MRFLMKLGVPQGLLPPQERPDMGALRAFGFTGSDAAVLERTAREVPEALAASTSASAMWAANAATVSPSADCADGRVHITAANLVSTMHRSLEAPQTERTLRAIFAGPRFVHHGALKAAPEMRDEGAANHTRLCARDARPPARYMARQSRMASEAVARQHLLEPDATIYLEQSAEAIDAGAFHTDVVAVGHRHVMLYHQKAFEEGEQAMARIGAAYERVTGGKFLPVCVGDDVLPLADAVRSYFFNSQLVTPPNGRMAFVAPAECQTMATARRAINFLREKVAELDGVHFVDVRQSMMNGGGPACLRLRVVLTEEERAAVAPGVMLTEELYEALKGWIQRHYREEIKPGDLADARLLEESRRALHELTGIMGMPGIYPFQRV
jgi:succinylarginine dihydrolase